MSQIQITLDASVGDLLGDSPEQIERSALEIIVLELCRRHEISAGRSAEIRGIDEFAFIRWASSLRIPYFDTTPEDWAQQLGAIDKE
jgi:hypothetical protein